MEWGLRGPTLPSTRALKLRLGATMERVVIGFTTGAVPALVPEILTGIRLIVLGLLGCAGNALARLLERRVLRWQSPR